MKYPIYGVWGICTLLILCLACQNEEPSAQHSTPPNILFITVDDLRPQLGAYGHEYMVTPHMDRLAKNGRLFANHYVIVPTCGPSRYTMLTGQYPVTRAELRNDIFEKTTAMNHRSDKPESMIEAFRRNGYYTVGIGNISHSPDGLVYGYTDSISDVRELPQSWDEFHFNHGKWGTGWNAFFGYADGGNRQSLDSEVKPYESAQVDDNGYPECPNKVRHALFSVCRILQTSSSFQRSTEILGPIPSGKSPPPRSSAASHEYPSIQFSRKR